MPLLFFSWEKGDFLFVVRTALVWKMFCWGSTFIFLLSLFPCFLGEAIEKEMNYVFGGEGGLFVHDSFFPISFLFWVAFVWISIWGAFFLCSLMGVFCVKGISLTFLIWTRPGCEGRNKKKKIALDGGERKASKFSEIC